jgi:hypothetical protein
VSTMLRLAVDLVNANLNNMARRMQQPSSWSGGHDCGCGGASCCGHTHHQCGCDCCTAFGPPQGCCQPSVNNCCH